VKISRQQRRAEQRSETKNLVASAKLQAATRRRIEARETWRNRHLVYRTRLQKLVLGFEVVFIIFGGPLVLWLYTPSWERQRISS
jgi:hypothetical protein